MQKFCSSREFSTPMPETPVLSVKHDTEEKSNSSVPRSRVFSFYATRCGTGNSLTARQGHPTCRAGNFRANVKESSEGVGLAATFVVARTYLRVARIRGLGYEDYWIYLACLLLERSNQGMPRGRTRKAKCDSVSRIKDLDIQNSI